MTFGFILSKLDSDHSLYLFLLCRICEIKPGNEIQEWYNRHAKITNLQVDWAESFIKYPATRIRL